MMHNSRVTSGGSGGRMTEDIIPCPPRRATNGNFVKGGRRLRSPAGRARLESQNPKSGPHIKENRDLSPFCYRLPGRARRRCAERLGLKRRAVAVKGTRSIGATTATHRGWSGPKTYEVRAIWMLLTWSPSRCCRSCGGIFCFRMLGASHETSGWYPIGETRHERPACAESLRD